MSDLTDKLLSEARKLTSQERARVALELIATMNGEPAADAEFTWAEEIDRRVQRIAAEGPTGDDWHIVHDRITARLRSK